MSAACLMTLAQAHALLQPLLPQARLVGEGATLLQRVHSDTRSLQVGDLFVALRGERFDANDFLAQARAAGAAAALAERGLEAAGLPGIEVPDAKLALGLLAQAWRARLQLPVIAVTGSNGKTTVTQMIASILSAWLGEDALATAGNLNNEIGVPLTVLRLRQDEHRWHRAAVIELGMNHPGEIAPLAAMAQPTVALVNNAQREHQEFLGTVEAAARENGEVIRALPAAGVAVFPAEDPCAPVWHELAGSRAQLSFALQGLADVCGRAQWMDAGHWALELHTPAGDAPVVLSVAGLHNVRNALAAATCCLAAGAPLATIVQGLEAFRPVKGRSALRQVQRAGRRLTLIDDSYNANPDSVRAGIEVLADLPGKSWLVLGDMGEVGEQGPAFHREVGAYAAQRGLAALWCAGPAAAHAAAAYEASMSASTAGADGAPDPSAPPTPPTQREASQAIACRAFATVEALIAALDAAPSVSNVLVKGSRFMRMERVVAALAGNQDQGGAHAA